MSERLNFEQLEQLKKELNVFDIYSFSRLNLYKTDAYSYLLKYILKIPEDRANSIYGVCGNLVHDLLEDFQAGKIIREKMIEDYKEKSFEMEMLGLKFDRNDDDKNENISKKYHLCNTHFLENFKKIEGKDGVSESSIIVKVGKFVFVGYVDYIHKECEKIIAKGGRGNANIIHFTSSEELIITDFKTSTIYKGEKIEKEKSQLLLYTLGYIQQGWDINKIKARWLFTKYINVEVMQKKKENGINLWNSRQIERNEIGSKLSASAEMWLKDTKRYTVEEINDFIVDMLVTNSIDKLPEDVKSKFKISDCYVYIDINQKEIDDLVEDFIKTIHEMKIKEGQYGRTKDDKVFWTEVTKKNEYFLSVLSGYSRHLHKPYNLYLQENEMNSKPFGISNKSSKSQSKVNKVEDDEIDILELLNQLED